MYYELVDDYISKNNEEKYKNIFQPPQIYTKNQLEVPVFTRVQDMMHSGMHFSNLYSSFDITFPLSNYTLSYKLAKKIGFWDTCAEAIGEDFHTTLKAIYKTNG